MNAIVIYLASELLDQALSWIRWIGPTGPVVLRDVVYQNVFAAWASPYNASLVYALAYVLVLYLFAWWLYARGWFVRV
jgi:predicted acyltransferase